jgi:hypothetical protein
MKRGVRRNALTIATDPRVRIGVVAAMGLIALSCRADPSIRADAGQGGPAPDALPAADERPGDALAACPRAASAPPAVLAARLSAFLWNEPVPSASLSSEVERAGSPEKIRDLASRMLADPRARNGVAAFFRSWLRLDDLATIAKPPGVITPELRASMQKEAPAFGVSVVLDGDGRYETLMLAPNTYLDELLARHYGIAGVTGPDLRSVPYGTPDRIGILMGAGVLTRFSGSIQPPWPPRRFWLTYEALLCDSTPLPAPAMNSIRGMDMTIRQELETRTSRAPCNACHVVVNPIGLAFAPFDTFGRMMTADEAGKAFDTTATVPSGLTLNAGLAIRSAPDMIRQLVVRPEVRRCFSARWLDYALRPQPRRGDEAAGVLPLELQCSLDEANAAFVSSGGDIRKLIAAITATPAFMNAGP